MAAGHFVAGMWGNTDFLGLTVMALEGRVHSAAIVPKSKKRSVRLQGTGTIDMGAGGFLTDVAFEAVITKGGPDVGTIQITVIGQFDGVPGDMVTGNGNYDQAPVTVRSGLIRIQ